MGDDRPIAYREDDRIIFRASASGMPARCLTAAILGYPAQPAPDYLMKAAERGNAAESLVKHQMRSDGWKVHGEQGSFTMHVAENVYLRGHYDGEHASHPDLYPEDRGLEVKSMSQNTFDKWVKGGFGAFPSYAAQITTYRHALGKDFIYAIMNWDDPQGPLMIFPVDEDPTDFDALKSKLLYVKSMVDMGQLPDCDRQPSQYRCAYIAMCDKEMADEPKIVRDPEVDHILAEYRTVMDQLKELEERKKGLLSQIKLELGEEDGLETARFKVSRYPQGRNSIDEEMLRRDLGQDTDRYLKRNEWDVVRVTRKKHG